MMAAAFDFQEAVALLQHQKLKQNNQGDTALMISIRVKACLTPLLLLEEAGLKNNQEQFAITILLENIEFYKENWILV